MYCCVTKNGILSIGFNVAGIESLSMIVTVATWGEPKTVPVGPLNVTVKFSFPSTSASLTMGIVIDLLASPAANRNVPTEVA